MWALKRLAGEAWSCRTRDLAVLDVAKMQQQPQDDVQSRASSTLDVDIPQPVREFITKFYTDFRLRNTHELVYDYESGWSKFTDKYFAKERWPDVDQIAFIVRDATAEIKRTVAKRANAEAKTRAAISAANPDNAALAAAAAAALAAAKAADVDAATTPTDDEEEDDAERLFFVLYRELYYRYVYTKHHPTVYDRIESYGNYVDLFNLILSTDVYADVELPPQWLWDIIDEFIYQFQSASKHRSKVHALSDADIEIMSERIDVGNIHNILNALYCLVQKSRINEQLIALQKDEKPEDAAGDIGSKPLYRMLGYFSLIGLLRVNCLVGDYSLALKSIEYIDLNKKGIVPRIGSCHVTTYYYLAFAYMMVRRYSDAARTCIQILNFISRSHYHNRGGYQFDDINKKSDQCYAILAICISLQPQRVEESIHAVLRDKHADNLTRLSKGGEDAMKAFEELFIFCCPKFISPINPNFEVYRELKAAEAQKKTTEEENEDVDSPKAFKNKFTGNEAMNHQKNVFLREISTQLLGSTIRSYMKLYTTLEVSKLASFLNIEPDEVATHLIVLKNKSRQKVWTSGNASDGAYQAITDLDFYIKGPLIYLSETKHGRRLGDWFVRNINRLEELNSQPFSEQQQQLQYQQQNGSGQLQSGSQNSGQRRRGGKNVGPNFKAGLNSNRLGRGVGSKKPKSSGPRQGQQQHKQAVTSSTN